MRMAELRAVQVFISHTWSDGNHYARAISLLDAIPDLNWKNFSVTSERPIISASTRGLAVQQELILRRDRIRDLDDQIEALKFEIVKRRVRLQEFGTWQALNDEIADLEKQIAAVHREIAHEQLIVDQLRKDCGLGLSLVVYEPRNLFFDVKNELLRDIDERYIALRLEDQIRHCDLFLLITGTFTLHRRWMEWELDIAERFRKPVILILREGQISPKELSRRGYEVVGWSRNSLARHC
jgi:cell division protein FtsL